MDHSSWAGAHTVFGRVVPEDMAVGGGCGMGSCGMSGCGMSGCGMGW